MKTGYIATVIDLFSSERYDRAVESLRETFPAVDWIEPARMNWTLEEWHCNWSEILPALDVLAVVPRPGGSIGRGVWTEITDCRERGIVVYALIDDSWTRGFEIERWPGESYKYWGEVRAHHGTP